MKNLMLSELEKNKLIAQFMGATNFCTEDEFLNYENTDPKAIILESLKYHSSWDELMPVVEKCLIGEAEQADDVTNIAIKSIYEALCNTNILEVFDSCANFIKRTKSLN